MSFPRAEIKRFNDKTGCAPPVGTYNLKDEKKANGGVIETSERFRQLKDVDPHLSGASITMPFSSPRLSSTPMKSRASNSSSLESVHSMTDKSNGRKPPQVREHVNRIKELELEVRQLLREKNEKDKELRCLKEEHQKLERRLNTANAERTSCLAQCAQLEHKDREIQRKMEALQKQLSTADTNGKRKEEKHRNELQSLQQQIRSKEQEILTMEKKISQALMDLVKDTEEFAKHSACLNTLLSKLDISPASVETADDLKTENTSEPAVDVQIRNIRQLIKGVSGFVSRLAESGVERVEALQSQVADSLVTHQQLQQQLTQRQDVCDSLQERITQLLQDCQVAEQRLEQTQRDYSEVQQCLQQSEEQQKEREAQLSQLQQEHQILQSKLEEEKNAFEAKLEEERQALQTTLRAEKDSLESRLEKEQSQISQIQEERQALESTLKQERAQMQQEQAAMERAFLQDREALESKLLQHQVALKNRLQKEWEAREAELHQEHTVAKQKLEQSCKLMEERCLQAQDRLDAVQKELVQKKAELEETLEQEQRKKEELSESGKELLHVQTELKDSQALCSSLQQDVLHLQDEVTRLKGLVIDLQNTREHLKVESNHLNLTKKELEVKSCLLADTIQMLKEDAYGETVTGTPTKVKQLLFEESAERVTLEEHVQQLIEENKSLNCTIQSLTEKYQNIIHQLEVDLILEKDNNSQMQTHFTVSEQKRQKAEKDLEETQLLNKDLRQNIDCFEMDLTRMKNVEQDRTREVDQLKHMNGELNAIIKDLHLRLEAEQHSSESAARDHQTRMECLQVEVKQHIIATQALQGEITHLKDTFAIEREELTEKCSSMEREKQKLVDKHKEDLVSVRKALALDRQTAEVQMEEFTVKLERAQTFNNQMKEELKRLLKEKEKLKHDSSTEITTLQTRIQTAESTLEQAAHEMTSLRQQLQNNSQETTRLQDLVAQLEQSVTSKEEERVYFETAIHHQQVLLAEKEEKIRELESEKEALELHVDKVSDERSMLETDLVKQMQTLQQEALEERTEFERMISEMSEKIQQLEEEKEQDGESEDWRQKYEDLHARVEPFMEQLDAFATERDLLLGRSKMAEAEVGKMMDKYAKLLGHQNQKQKIQYINKLKEEYMQCRKEREALKELSKKQQTTIQKLEKKVNNLEGRKTFDPSQAFKHASKDDVPRSPLRQTNK